MFWVVSNFNGYISMCICGYIYVRLASLQWMFVHDLLKTAFNLTPN